mmetsp:Transcript_47394/g.141458  ORF Transcript_47394/g.141458 Transcript_47394/m.141458 type:complete len:202 (+) Transcript_47394:227-832(+)
MQLREVGDRGLDVLNRRVPGGQQREMLRAVQHLDEGGVVEVPGCAAVEPSQADGHGREVAVAHAAGRPDVDVAQGCPLVPELAEDVPVPVRVPAHPALHPVLHVLSKPHLREALPRATNLGGRAGGVPHGLQQRPPLQPLRQLLVPADGDVDHVWSGTQGEPARIALAVDRNSPLLDVAPPRPRLRCWIQVAGANSIGTDA